MRLFSALLGLCAVEKEGGSPQGRVEGLCLAPDGQRAEGLVLCRMGLLKRHRFVPFERVLLFGEHTLTVESPVRDKKARRRSLALLGETVRDTSGQTLGWVTDGLLEESTGQVLGIQVSFGLWEDLTVGRKWFSDFILRPGGGVVAADGDEREKWERREEKCSE